MKHRTIPPCREPVFPRSDAAALAAFDPQSKRCVMNCSQIAGDPRSRAEAMFQCGDCEPVDVTQLPTRFCPECGLLGEFDRRRHRDCCPDGDKARYVPRAFAERCHATYMALRALGGDLGEHRGDFAINGKNADKGEGTDG